MKRGFTLVELLVVIAIIGILAGLLLPVLSRAKNRAQGSLCLNNGKQLMIAMTLYTGDNNDFFPPNPDDGNTVPGHNWCAGKAGQGGREEFNPDVIKDPNRNLLASFLGGNIGVFRCPADRRSGTYQGADPNLFGVDVPAARTFAMSQAVGTICPGFDEGSGHQGIPRLPVNGPWLDNSYGHRRNSPWSTYGRLSTIRAPGPAQLWVFTDEDPQGLNDAAFAFGMESAAWFDRPGSYHNRGCGFAFADGHSETHYWLENPRNYDIQEPITSSRGQQDWAWMRERTSAHASGSTPPPQ